MYQGGVSSRRKQIPAATHHRFGEDSHGESEKRAVYLTSRVPQAWKKWIVLNNETSGCSALKRWQIQGPSVGVAQFLQVQSLGSRRALVMFRELYFWVFWTQAMKNSISSPLLWVLFKATRPISGHRTDKDTQHHKVTLRQLPQLPFFSFILFYIIFWFCFFKYYFCFSGWIYEGCKDRWSF